MNLRREYIEPFEINDPISIERSSSCSCNVNRNAVAGAVVLCLVFLALGFALSSLKGIAHVPIVFYGDESGRIDFPDEELASVEQMVSVAYERLGGNVVQAQGIPLDKYYNCWAVYRTDAGKISAIFMGWIPSEEYTSTCEFMKNVKLGVVATATFPESKQHLKMLGKRLLDPSGNHRWWGEYSPPLFWTFMEFSPVIQNPVVYNTLIQDAHPLPYCTKKFKGNALPPIHGCYFRELGGERHEKIILGCPTYLEAREGDPNPYVEDQNLAVCDYGNPGQISVALEKLRRQEAEHLSRSCDTEGLLKHEIMIDMELCSDEVQTRAQEPDTLMPSTMTHLFLRQLVADAVQVRSRDTREFTYFLCAVPEDICIKHYGKPQLVQAQDWLRFRFNDKGISYFSKLSCTDAHLYHDMQRLSKTKSMATMTAMVADMISDMNLAVCSPLSRLQYVKKIAREQLIEQMEVHKYMTPWGAIEDLSQATDKSIYLVSPFCYQDSQYAKIWVVNQSIFRRRYEITSTHTAL